MPEGDTVWLTAHRLNAALAGRVLTRCDLRVPTLALSDLTGSTVSEVVARGKHILMRFDDARTLHSHLRMDGSWRIAASGATVRDAFDVRAVIGNAEWIARGIRVHDLDLARTDDGDRWVGHLGPDVLGRDWDPQRAATNLGRDDRSVVEALLDQRNLAGIGNMYAAELMFLAGINPFTPASAVPNPTALARTAFKALRANRDHPEQSTTGRTARGEQHWVYLRTAQPCRRCRTPIVTAEFGTAPRQRSTFWCPYCQPANPSRSGPETKDANRR